MVQPITAGLADVVGTLVVVAAARQQISRSRTAELVRPS
jgi:hypothetical protein